MYLPYFPNLQIGKNNIFWTTRCILFAFSFKINAGIYFKIFKIFLGMAFQTPASKSSHHQHSPYLLVCNFLTDRLATIQIYYRKFRRDYCASTDFSLYRSNLYKFQTYTATVPLDGNIVNHKIFPIIKELYKRIFFWVIFLMFEFVHMQGHVTLLNMGEAFIR